MKMDDGSYLESKQLDAFNSSRLQGNLKVFVTKANKMLSTVCLFTDGQVFLLFMSRPPSVRFWFWLKDEPSINNQMHLHNVLSTNNTSTIIYLINHIWLNLESQGLDFMLVFGKRYYIFPLICIFANLIDLVHTVYYTSKNGLHLVE